MYREDDKLKFYRMIEKINKVDLLNLMMVAYESDEEMGKFIEWCRNMLRKPVVTLSRG